MNGGATACEDREGERGDLAARPRLQGTAYRGWARAARPRDGAGPGGGGAGHGAPRSASRSASPGARTPACTPGRRWRRSPARARTVAPERLRLSLNALLPPDIAVLARGAGGRRASWPARPSSRSYRYDLWATAVKPVRERAFVWVLRGAVDGAALRAAAGAAARAPRLRRPHALRAPVPHLRARGDAPPSGPTTARRRTARGGAGASRSPPAASCTTWSASPWARWSTWRRGA